MTMQPFFEDIIIEMSGQGPTGKTGNSIERIEKTSSVGLTDIYTIYMTWGQTYTFEVENGNGIVSITKTGTNILTDTYTILFSNGDTTTFDVVNGNGIGSITLISEIGLVKTYRISYTDGTHFDFSVEDGNGISSVDKISTDVLEDTYQISFTSGATTTFKVDNGRGITSIEKSGSHDLQDIYSINYNDGTVSTFTVTNGEAATITLGTVSTGQPGTNAIITNTGDNHNAVFNFVIPRGNTGNGISKIELLSESGLDKTYRVTYTDGNHFDYTVSDGNGITSIELLSTSGLDKTYRISFDNGDHFDFVVHDGNGIASITKTGSTGAVDHYRVSFTDTTYFDYDVTNGSDTWGAIVGDIADQTDLQTALDNKAPVITESAQGDIVTITDGADNLPVESLSVSVEPVQDLHGYDAPWPAGGGSNIWDEEWELGGLPSGVPDSTTNKIRSKNFTQVSENTKYYCFDGGGGSINVYFYDANKDYLSSSSTANREFTTPAGCAFIKLACSTGYGTTYNNNIAINYPSTVTTYSPYSNICPISGHTQANVTRTGVNLFDQDTVYANFKQNDGTFSGYNTEINSITYTIPKNCIGKTLTFSAYILNTSTSNVRTRARVNGVAINGTNISAGGTSYVLSQVTFTPETENDAINITYGSASAQQYSFKNCQLELGSTASPYSAYQGTTLTIPLGQTVYGATVDVGAGTLTVTHVQVDLGDLTWGYSTSYMRFTGALPYQAVSDSAEARESCICSNYRTSTNAYYDNNRVNNAICVSGMNTFVRDFAYSDATAFKTAMSGVQLVYELRTPTVITGLTPAILRTLLGTNNIWADCGDTSVTYRADTKLFVEQSIAEANATTRKMIADTANGNLAPKSLASGDLIIVGEELRKCTANIGSGSAITDSNSTVANLADVIKALQ